MPEMSLTPVPPLEAGLLKAYEAADYRVLVTPLVTLRIGQVSKEAKDLLCRHAASNGIVVTAWNPYGRSPSSSENDKRGRRLHEWILERGLSWLPAEGADPSGVWPAETSALVMGVSGTLVDELLTRFEQHAVVEISTSGVPRLILHPKHRETLSDELGHGGG